MLRIIIFVDVLVSVIVVVGVIITFYYYCRSDKTDGRTSDFCAVYLHSRRERFGGEELGGGGGGRSKNIYFARNYNGSTDEGAIIVFVQNCVFERLMFSGGASKRTTADRR